MTNPYEFMKRNFFIRKFVFRRLMKFPENINYHIAVGSKRSNTPNL